VLTAGLVEHDAMARHLRRILAKAPTLPVYARTRLSDADVLTYITQQRRVDVNVSRSRLLAELRASGRACEQQRFADLFATATGGGG
jgi:hypothetical protein